MRMTGSGIPTNHKISPRLMSNAPQLNLFFTTKGDGLGSPRATRGCVEQSWHDDQAKDAPIASRKARGSGPQAAAAHAAPRIAETDVAGGESWG